MTAKEKGRPHAQPSRHNRAHLSKGLVLAAAASLWLLSAISEDAVSHAADERLDFTIELTTARKGFDGEKCWVHARAGVIPPKATGNPSETPLVVMTLNELLLSGSDVFYATNDMRSTDLGQTWDGPRSHTATMGRRTEPDDVEVAPCDLTPMWHAASGKLLCTGQNVRYTGDRRPMSVRRRETIFSVYDPAERTWSPWQTMAMPNMPRFQHSGAGSTQRLDLPNGDILLPIYFKRPEEKQHSAAVVRCRFDGRTLSYIEHGDELTVPVQRGFCEPSLTRFGDRFYLTLRNDVKGYVTSGPDGLHFDEPKPWRFDDGSELGSYNTQQHWVTHSDGLWLVYTRRGADNDHVFRHRAPLFIARVDPERLCVIRATERILVPERGARLGNFGVTDVSPNETWVTVTEWMQPPGVEQHGSDNSLFIAKIKWNRPNRLVK
ncbi:MAG TPA: sialidase family protein [Thermoguttaceae bacterium]|nr:sialidase family protein [Thermoguttaceae bacterium]